MRPTILQPLFAEVRTLPGIGPRLAQLVAKLAGERVWHLLEHLPSGVIDRSRRVQVADAPDGRIATLTVTVDHHEPAPDRRRPYRVRCHDDSGPLDLVYFHANATYLERLLPPGAVRLVSGKLEHWQDRAQISHPDHVVPPEEADSLPLIEPVYPLTTGLTPKVLLKAMSGAVERIPVLPEWQAPGLPEREGWPVWDVALRRCHAPEGEGDLDLQTPWRRRLAYDELLSNQLALLLVRARTRRSKGRPTRGDGRLRDRAEAALPYRLTGDQRKALAEIAGDMASDRRMLRLLQGDVGSGKTVVAALAMLAAVEEGGQAALVAPTEILARQHLESLREIAEPLGIEVVGLTGRDKGKARTALLEALSSGRAGLVVGTHALFQEEVGFADLRLAVIDEQHRFGVHQRMLISEKGRGVDLLVMTATPIPRTLLLSAYGDLDSSRLMEKPPGRQPIVTIAKPQDRMEEVLEGIARQLAEGARAYWVCPLVEEDETSDLTAAEARATALSERFPGQVGLVHGRMTPKDKDRAVADFADGRTQILVATTVIEVGIHVPDATLMVIEHAERFGLAQLHQLRGRVGRGRERSVCLLLYRAPLGETARQRIKTMRETDDGFVIAEADLKLRGGGEVLGTRQSGLPEFRFADLAVHNDLLPVAHDDARLVLEQDPELTGSRGEALRTLLYLFERDAAIRFLRSG